LPEETPPGEKPRGEKKSGERHMLRTLGLGLITGAIFAATVGLGGLMVPVSQTFGRQKEGESRERPTFFVVHCDLN
jgi:hypothetical protein